MLLAAGLFDLGFALFHALFWRLFGWPQRLATSGNVNAAITQTLNLMIIFVFTAYGATLLWQSAQPNVHPALSLAGATFWALRFGLQFVWFDLRPWPSRLIAVVFALTAIVHLLAARA